MIPSFSGQSQIIEAVESGWGAGVLGLFDGVSERPPAEFYWGCRKRDSLSIKLRVQCQEQNASEVDLSVSYIQLSRQTAPH
jgi:hypothetical protein